MADGAEDLRLWDAAASGYAGRADSFYQRVHRFIRDRRGAVQGLDVLDLGCGDGWLAAPAEFGTFPRPYSLERGGGGS